MQKLNAAVVIPPVEDFYFSPRRFASLGALKAAEILENHGAVVKVYDFTAEDGIKTTMPGYLEHLEPFILEKETGSCSFFTDYKRFGLTAERCASIVAEGNHDIVFFALFAYSYAETALSAAAELKKLKPGIVTAAGGAGVTVLPGLFRPHFDYVFTGEAEVCLENYLTGIEKSSGVSPDFSPSIAVTGWTKKTLYLSVMLTRGCGKRCRFCSNFIVHGRTFRKSGLSRIRENLDKIKSTLTLHAGKKVLINFEDDNLLCDPVYFFNAIDIFKNYFTENNILFSAENGLDYSLLTEELCGRLIDQGFRQFNFTLGSSDSLVNRMESRKSDSDALKNILLYLNRRDIPAVSYFIAGLEHDTPEKTVKSLLYLYKLPGLCGISMFYAVPGLPGFENHEQLLSIPPGLFKGSSAYPWNSSLSTSQLVTAFRISRTINLFKQKTVSPHDMVLSDLIRKEKKLFTLIKKGSAVLPVRPPGIDREMEKWFFSEAVF